MDKAEALDSRDASRERYLVTSYADRIAILTQLCARRSLIRVQPFGSSEPVLSVLLVVDAAQQVMILDASRSPETNQSVQQSDQLTLVTELDGIRIEFDVSSPQIISYLEGAALAVDIPRSILRLQRREFFRIAPPSNRPILVQLQSIFADGRPVTAARGIDISCGGMVILIEGEVTGLEAGQILPETSITLPDVATIQTGLEVRNILYSSRGTGVGTTRVGCRFVGLNQASSARVQRYINRLEVELRRRL